MQDIVVITKATYVDGHTLELTFSDGVKAIVDFSPWIDKYPFFAQLKDTEYFKNFTLDGWTVVWPNGADVAPETLHRVATRESQSQET